MQSKLDMSRAWNEATAMLSANLQVLLVVAGVFIFLPNAVAALFMPSIGEVFVQVEALGPTPNPDDVLALFSEFFGRTWWIYLLLALLQAIGMLGMLALLSDSNRPTVGQALSFGAMAVVPYVVGQLLIGLAQAGAILVPVALGAAIAVGIGLLLGMIGTVVAVYLWVKFSLLAPVMAIERKLNPVAALARSWRLTKGNSLGLFAFYALILVAVMVIGLVAQLVVSVFSLLGPSALMLAAALVGSLLTLGYNLVMLSVLAAVHRQLSGGTGHDIGMTFG